MKNNLNSSPSETIQIVLFALFVAIITTTIWRIIDSKIENPDLSMILIFLVASSCLLFLHQKYQGKRTREIITGSSDFSLVSTRDILPLLTSQVKRAKDIIETVGNGYCDIDLDSCDKVFRQDLLTYYKALEQVSTRISNPIEYIRICPKIMLGQHEFLNHVKRCLALNGIKICFLEDFGLANRFILIDDSFLIIHIANQDNDFTPGLESNILCTNKSIIQQFKLIFKSEIKDRHTINTVEQLNNELHAKKETYTNIEAFKNIIQQADSKDLSFKLYHNDLKTYLSLIKNMDNVTPELMEKNKMFWGMIRSLGKIRNGSLADIYRKVEIGILKSNLNGYADNSIKIFHESGITQLGNLFNATLDNLDQGDLYTAFAFFETWHQVRSCGNTSFLQALNNALINGVIIKRIFILNMVDFQYNSAKMDRSSFDLKRQEIREIIEFNMAQATRHSGNFEFEYVILSNEDYLRQKSNLSMTYVKRSKYSEEVLIKSNHDASEGSDISVGTTNIKFHYGQRRLDATPLHLQRFHNDFKVYKKKSNDQKTNPVYQEIRKWLEAGHDAVSSPLIIDKTGLLRDSSESA